MTDRGTAKPRNHLHKSPPLSATPAAPSRPSILSLTRIAEARIFTALTIHSEDPQSLGLDIQKQRRTLWARSPTPQQEIKLDILSIMLDILEGKRRPTNDRPDRPTILQHALFRLDYSLADWRNRENELEQAYETEYHSLVKKWGEDSAAAELYRVKVEIIKFYMRGGVFDGGEFRTRKVENWVRWDTPVARWNTGREIGVLGGLFQKEAWVDTRGSIWTQS